MPNHVQMLYDGTNMNRAMGPTIERGDKSFYNGRYSNARGYYNASFMSLPQKSTEVSTTLFGPVDPNIAFSVNENALDAQQARLYTGLLNSLGIYWQSRGRYQRSIQYFELAMEIRARIFGKSSPAFINSLHNLAVIKKDLGEYVEAEFIFSYLERVIPQLYTKDSYHYAVLLNNKAMLLASLGRTKEALTFLDESLSIAEEKFIDTYIDYERLLLNKGMLLYEMGDLNAAIGSLTKASEGMVQKGYENHPDHNEVLIYLGRLYLDVDPNYAFSYIQESTAGAKRRYGAKHLLYAEALENNGLYYMKNNNYEKARDIFLEVLEIQFENLGDQHKEYMQTQIMLAACYWHLKDTSISASYFISAMNSYLFIIDSLFPSLSESEKGELWSTIKPNIDLFLSFTCENLEGNEHLAREAYNIHVRTKAILINSTTKAKENILSSNDEELIARYNEWVELKNLVAFYYSLPKAQLEDEKIDLMALEIEANELEKSLSRQSAKFQESVELYKDYFQDNKSKLLPDQTVVEIARIKPYIGPKKDTIKYIAFMYESESENPSIVVFENGEEMEEKYYKYYKTAIKFKTNDEYSFTQYWAPIERQLNNTGEIFLSVDGVYNNINILTLPYEENFLLNKRSWTFLTNSRYVTQLQDNNDEELLSTKSATLFGNPNFGRDDLISPLPGTAVEIEQINQKLSTSGYEISKFSEATATEDNLKTVTSPLILHIATHGFFLSDVDNNKDMVMGIQVSKAKNNPLLRSGLMLTDAGKVYSNEPVFDNQSNGVLNAYEAMNLDLEGTELVVLSACETGAGEVRNGEGVYGLPRAFQVAGADNIIMSLWKVDDTATQELMTDFYNNLTKGESLERSLQLAQSNIKEKYEHPYYWGAFVLMEN